MADIVNKGYLVRRVFVPLDQRFFPYENSGPPYSRPVHDLALFSEIMLLLSFFVSSLSNGMEECLAVALTSSADSNGTSTG